MQKRDLWRTEDYDRLLISMKLQITRSVASEKIIAFYSLKREVKYFVDFYRSIVI